MSAPVRHAEPPHRPAAWLTAGQFMIERDPRPAMLVDAAGSIQAVNRAFNPDDVPGAAPLVGRRWLDAWPFDPHAASIAAEGVARAQRGEVTQVTLSAPAGQGGRTLWLFELMPLGGGPDGGVLIAVLATTVARVAEGVTPAGGLHYELDAKVPWRLRQVWSAAARPIRTDGPCYQVLHGRSQPCEGCPAQLLDGSGDAEAHAVLPAPGPRLRLNVVDARRTDRGTVAISVWSVDESLLSTLIAGKLAALARAAGLSARERAVLDLLVLGRSHQEIGMVLGVTSHTAKYHHARIRSKLGIDSRFDLLRIIL